MGDNNRMKTTTRTDEQVLKANYPKDDMVHTEEQQFDNCSISSDEKIIKSFTDADRFNQEPICKTLEPTGDLCIKFTDEELDRLGIKKGDKFSLKEDSEGILLLKYETVDLDLGELSREILEMLITESCEKDISINEVISNILEKVLLIQEKA